MASGVVSRDTTWREPSQATAVRRTGMQHLATATIVGLTVVSLIVRLAHIDFQSLWLDEGYTLLFSGMALPKLITVGGAHEHPPLYYLLVHLVVSVHHSYLVPRLLSVLAGTLTIPVL